MDIPRVVAYFRELESMDSENAIEDHLLITPRLDAAVLANEEVQGLLARGLASPSVAIRSFCLSKALPKIGPSEFSDNLWHSVLCLVRDDDVGVSQRAIALAASHATASRLSGPLETLDRLEKESVMGELRVLEFGVRVAASAVSGEVVRVPYVARLLSRLYSLAVGEEVDPLTQLSALELVSGGLVGNAWCRDAVLDAGLIERALLKATRSDEGLAPALLRFAGAVVASCGERGLEQVQRGGGLGSVVAALDDPAVERVLDGCLCLAEGTARSCDAGRRLVCESGVLKAAVERVLRSGDLFVRVRCAHCVADVLSTLDGAVGPEVRLLVARTVENAGDALVARLLHLASSPLLTEQRAAVFLLLAALAKHLPEFAFKSSNNLFAFVINRAADGQKDALEWRFTMVELALASKELFTETQIHSLQQYQRQGAFYREHRADVESGAK